MAEELSPDTQIFRIDYLGGLADRDAIPLDDLINSLRGFERLFELTDSMFIQGRLTLRPLPVEHRLQIRVRRIGPRQSISAELEFVNLLTALGLGVAGSAIWDGIKLATTKLWKWRKNIIESRAKPVKLPWNIEEAAAALEVLAREAGIRSSEDEEDPVEIIQELNGALIEAIAPIDVSVESIRVENEETQTTVSLGRAEKVAIQSQPIKDYRPIEVGDWEPVDVAIVKVHTGTGHALIKFKNSKGDDQRGIKPCTIVDPRFRRANDPFTQTLSRRSFMHAWARKAIFNPETGAFRWELRLTPPMDQMGLFAGPIPLTDKARPLLPPGSKKARRGKKQSKRR